MTAKNIMWHWKNNTKESEKITFGDVVTAKLLIERIIADRKRISRAFIVGGLLLVASQVFRMVLGEFSIQEKGNFNTRYHYISSYIMSLSWYIIVYHLQYHDISCPSSTHDINDIHDIWNVTWYHMIYRALFDNMIPTWYWMIQKHDTEQLISWAVSWRVCIMSWYQWYMDMIPEWHHLGETGQTIFTFTFISWYHYVSTLCVD